MSDQQVQIKTFDAFFIKNRSKLRTMAQQICYGHESFEDILQDNYIKIRSRLQQPSGFTFTLNKYPTLDRSFTAYFWRAMKNDYTLMQKRQSKRHKLDIADPVVEDIANQILINEVHDKQAYYDQTEIIVRHLFRFVSIHYNERHQFLWKSYYLNPDSRTYKSLAELTGYEQKTISNVITTIKTDIKTNFIPWLKIELKAKRNYIVDDD